MLEASCHCGAVRFQVPGPPTHVTACNCSLCRRLGQLGAPYAPDEVRFIAGEGHTVTYVQGDGTLAMHFCATCFCHTHAVGIGDYAGKFMKVNARLFDPAEVERWRVRHFDGADTWEFLD